MSIRYISKVDTFEHGDPFKDTYKVLDLMRQHKGPSDRFRILLYSPSHLFSNRYHGNAAWEACDFADIVLCSSSNVLTEGILSIPVLSH